MTDTTNKVQLANDYATRAADEYMDLYFENRPEEAARYKDLRESAKWNEIWCSAYEAYMGY